MYRLHPQTARIGELIAAGSIGEVRMIQSSFGFQMPHFMPEHRLFANELAGGGILDVGGYPVSMARYIAGAAAGRYPCRQPAGMGHGSSCAWQDTAPASRPTVSLYCVAASLK